MDGVGRLVPVADDAPERVKRQGACFDSPKRLAVNARAVVSTVNGLDARPHSSGEYKDALALYRVRAGR